MKKYLLPIIMSYCTVVLASRAQMIPAQINDSCGEWPTLRGNNKRDGRVVSKGQFRNEAKLSQSLDFATSVAYVELSPAEVRSTVNFNVNETNSVDRLAALNAEWQIENGAYLDLLGDGVLTKVSVAQNVKYARLFKNDNKYYRIEAHDGYAFGNTDTTYVGFRVYEGNSTKLIFDKKFKRGVYMQRPHVLVDDMNNDGTKEIVITSWEGIYVFNNKGDSIGGLSQNVKGWHHLRKRGFASLQDIDGNGYKDVIIIGAFPYHLDVIKNESGVLKFGWTRIFDGQIESAKKISKPILSSVRDFDGDGTYEILVNVFNYNDEKNWSGVIFDPRDGKVKAQIRNSFITSANDINSDGKYVFFCTETQGQSIPVTARLKVVSFRKNKIIELLQIDHGEWINPRIVNTSPTVTTHTDGISNLAEDAVLCVDYKNAGQKTFFVKTSNADGTSSINGYYVLEDGKVKKTAMDINIPAGMYGKIIRERMKSNSEHVLLLQIKAFTAPGGTITFAGTVAKSLGRYYTTSEITHLPIVADTDSDGRAEILICNDVGEVLCFSRGGDGAMQIKWRVSGHGMTYQYNRHFDYGISVDDLDHDGFKEVIVSGGNEAGAVLFTYSHDGKLLWQRGFSEINAGDITIFNGNVAFYGTAQSSKRKHKDVIVTVQRVVQHTGQTYCLNGIDGSVVWVLDTLMADRGPGQGTPVVSGAGGNIFSTYDIDGDGSEEVMCGFGNIVFFADSNDGTLKFKSFMRKLYLDKYDYVTNGYKTFWIAEMLPVAFSDQHEIRLASFNTLAGGTMDRKGALSWCSKVLLYSGRYWQCMANVDGDGKLWVVELSTRSSDGQQVLFAYDPVNGMEHAGFSIEISGTMPVACDMNGDGNDEIIVTNDTGIHCIGFYNGKVTVLWEYLVKNCAPAIVADVDTDGFVEVIAATRAGEIIIIDN